MTCVTPDFKKILLIILLVSFIRGAVSGQNAIDFTLNDLKGKTVRLSDYIGEHVILIDFWATWCVPCVKELPHFQRFHEKYEEKGLKILAITVDGPETVALVRPFMQRYKYTFPVLMDVESNVIALYNPRVIMPYTILIDWQGRIRYVHQGYSLGDEVRLEEEVLKLLEEEKTEVKEFKVSISGNETLLSRNFSDDDYVKYIRDGKRSQVINRFDLNVNVGQFLAGFRFDADIDFSPWEDEYSLEKRFVEWNSRSLNLRAGDFYYSVGRGLMFSVLKTFEKEGLEFIIDKTVDGGKAFFRHKNFSAEVFGGWLKREESLLGQEDIHDTVLSGSVGYKIKGSVEIKLNFLGSQLKEGSAAGNKQVTQESFSLNIPNISDWAKLYGEFLLIQRDKYYVEDRINGHGIYLESGLFFGDLTLLVEFKDYKHLDFEYSRPPLLESEQLPEIANQFAKDSDDVTAAALRLDYYFPKVTTLLWGRTTYFDDDSFGFPREIFHLYGGVEKKFKENGWWNVLLGYRVESTESLVYYYTAGKTLHGQFNVSYPLTSRWSLELDFKGKDFKGKDYKIIDPGDYFEWRSYITFAYSPRWLVTFFYDRTTDPALLTFKDKKDWVAAQVEYRLTTANSIKVFFGAMKGGVKCAGGVCKFFPSFEGLRIDATFRF